MQDEKLPRDPASGYASADVLDPADPTNRDRTDELDEETQDAMSGYASADAFDPDAADLAEILQNADAVGVGALDRVFDAEKTLKRVLSCKPPQVPVAVCDAFDLNLAGLISTYWRPSPDTFRLAERLHTRSDVAWPAMETLLTAVPSGQLVEAAQ